MKRGIIEKKTKDDLIKIAKKNGFFKKPSVKSIWGRENGHFYYIKPPLFTDGLKSFEIKREDTVVKKQPKKQPKKTE